MTDQEARSAALTRFGILHRPTANFLAEFPTREEAEACIAEFSDADKFEIVDFEEIEKASAATTKGGNDDSTEAQADSRRRLQARVERVGVNRLVCREALPRSLGGWTLVPVCVAEGTRWSAQAPARSCARKSHAGGVGMKAKRKPQRAKQLGVTDAAYQQLLEAQEGGCAICGGVPKRLKKDGTPYRFQVDHNHRTGKVRGLLCFRCNRALPTYATSDWLRGAYVYVLRAESLDGTP